jgi:hypothetical protein
MAKSLTVLRLQSRRGGLQEEVNETRVRKKELKEGIGRKWDKLK